MKMLRSRSALARLFAGLSALAAASVAPSAAQAQTDSTPPRVIGIAPAPGAWIVDNLGVRTVVLQFDEAVTAPPTSVSVWRHREAAPPERIEGVASAYDPALRQLTATLPTPWRQALLTVVVDYSIVDGAGNPLDGELSDAIIGAPPTGDGLPGGQTVFTINALQGDADRSGTVDSLDATLIFNALGGLVGDPGVDARADLNGDGVINVVDITIFINGFGGYLPNADGTRPQVVQVLPDPGQPVKGPIGSVTVVFDEPVQRDTITSQSLFVTDLARTLTASTSVQVGPDQLSAVFLFDPPLPHCDRYIINLSSGVLDPSGSLLAPPLPGPSLTGVSPPPLVSVKPLPPATREDAVDMTGSAAEAERVEVSGPGGVVIAPVVGGMFSIKAPLALNRANLLYVTGISQCGTRGAPVALSVIQDMTGPTLFIESPDAADRPTDPSIDVMGRVADMLSGFMGLSVEVNGISAAVSVGVGTNGSFLARGVPLNAIDQDTVIHAVARDMLGNETRRQVIVRRAALVGPRMAIISGNGQAGPINTYLPQPIVVQVTNADGTVFPNKIVTFEVERNDGRISAVPAGVPDMIFQTRTDAMGLARARWRLGGTAGMGNNRVRATSADISGFISFCASAGPGPAAQINIGSGNGQAAEVGAPAPMPLVAWVSDSCNGIEGVPVVFTVVSGDGLVDGEASVVRPTDRTGHASVAFTAGLEPGNNVVEASFMGNKTGPATFVTRGVVRNQESPTAFSGAVFDNAMTPVGGVTIDLHVSRKLVGSATTDAQGQFRIDGFDASGEAELGVEGATATLLGGMPLPPGTTFPSLHYEFSIVPNAENTLGRPILLPPLRSANVRDYSTTQDTVLTVDGIEGLTFTVRAGSMRLANGQPAPDGTHLALNQVHHDDVPMPMPDGVAPPFAWTLKPAGATFDPPIEVEYPNMTGLPAGGIAYFLSFNHDTSRFEIVASGHVTEDGSLIRTDVGSGLSIAGWGCNCPPYAVATDCCVGECMDGGDFAFAPSGPPQIACLGSPMTFSAPAVTDKGGRLACPDGSNSMQIPPGALSYVYEVTGPPGFDPIGGKGSSVTLTPTLEGEYRCLFTVSVKRQCAPPDQRLPAQVASVRPSGVRIVSADLPANTIGIEVAVCGEQSGGELVVSVDDVMVFQTTVNGPSSIVATFGDRNDLPNNTSFANINAALTIGKTTVKATPYPYRFRVLSVYRHSQYNIPYEGDPTCSGGGAAAVHITNSSCNFVASMLSEPFRRQVDLNGTGDSSAHGRISREFFCLNHANRPPSAQDGFIFRRGAPGAGACGSLSGSTVAVLPNHPDLRCGDSIYLVGADTLKTVTDYCPGCDVRQCDNFTSDQRCGGIVDLGQYKTIRIGR